MTDHEAFKKELEEALQELDDLCDPDIPIPERKMWLSARKEKSKTLRLYVKSLERETEAAAEDTESAELAEVREHLEPLDLAPEGTPLPELARLAALKIMQR
jgi:hypothetical protein